MKLSISWIFDHIAADWKKIDINDLVTKFNKTTAEIESVRKIKIDLSVLFLAKVVSIGDESVILYCAELKKEIELPKRKDLRVGDLFFVKKVKQEYDNEFEWAYLSDLGSQKEGPIAALYVNEEHVSGKWKEVFETEDYVLEVDNKSVTHRPDLWGHRGFASEIAAILNLELLPLDKFIAKINIKTYSLNTEDKNTCKSFATLLIDEIEYKASIPAMALRLAKVDARPLNLIVDATNYVMFDLGQPMHAFDADKIKNKTIFPRFAKPGEKLVLLDDETVQLTSEDIIISDEQNPLALAGIMGGSQTAVSQNTKSILLEAACFDATLIRKSSIRFKKRTEASARFEKSLDSNQNIPAIERFVNIMNINNINTYNINSYFAAGIHDTKIIVCHDFIVKRLGTEIKPDFIIIILKKLGFEVKQKNDDYEITVPTFRSTKDVTIPEDIVEEIGRFFGYENVGFTLPSKQMIPNDFTPTAKTRKIKQFMGYSAHMHEVENYPFYDESFLNEFGWQPQNTISVLSPISENWKSLVTSLVPHLLKNIKQNSAKSDKLRFFECNKIWPGKIESKSMAGVFFEQQNPIDFYEIKSYLSGLFDLLEIEINWVKESDKSRINLVTDWYDKTKSAFLVHDGNAIGIVGSIEQSFLKKVIDRGNIFIFELNMDYLLKYKSSITKFKPLIKYPAVWLDISMFVPLNITVENIGKIIKDSDNKIYKADLVDSFEKDEWHDKKSITFRYHFVDEHKTLSKEEINEVMNKVSDNLKKIDAQLR